MKVRRFRNAIILLLILTVFAQYLAPIDDAYASPSYGQVWYDVQIGNTVYTVYLDLEPGQTITGQLTEAAHSGILDNIYVVNANTQQLVTDPDLAKRAALLAQNRAIVSANSYWMNRYSNWDYITFHNDLVDNEGQTFRVGLPSSASSTYAWWLIDGRLGDNLKNVDVRRDYYVEVIRAMVFPELTDDDVEKLEGEFDRDFGEVFEAAKQDAVDHGKQPGTVAWAVHIWTVFTSLAEFAVKSNAAGHGVEFVSKFSPVVGAAGIYLEFKDATEFWDETSTKSQLMMAYMQGLGAERLAALSDFVHDPSNTIDHIFVEAVDELEAELDTIDEATWRYIFAEWLQSDTAIGHTLDLLTFVGSVASVISLLPFVTLSAPVIAAIIVVEVIWIGYRAWQLLWGWFDTRDDQVSLAGVVKTIEDDMRREMEVRFASSPPPNQELDQWLLFSNMRIQADAMFFNILLERTSWVDEFFWWLWGGDPDEVIQNLTDERNLRWTLFLQTLPRVYWAYPDANWIIQQVNVTPPPDAPPTLVSPQILPEQGDTFTTFAFRISYRDTDGDAPTYVRAVVDGGPHTMSGAGSDYQSGVQFSYTGGPYSEGTHSYYFTAESNGVTVRYPASGNLSFEVQDVAAGFSLAADRYTLPFDGSSVNLTATVTRADGSPIVGETVTFSSYPGIINPRTTVTNASGKAYSTFTPDEVGTAQVWASLDDGTSTPTKTITTTPASNAITCALSVDTKVRTETTTTYDIEADCKFTATGADVGYTDIVFSVKDTSGAYYGVLYGSEYGQTGNPITDRTDNWGDADADLTVTRSDTAIISVEVAGSVSSTTVYLTAGQITPANVRPFITMPLPGETSDLALSTDGQYLVGLSVTNYSSYVYDTSSYSVYNHLYDSSDGDYYPESYGADFSPTGNYLAVAIDREKNQADQYRSVLIANPATFAYVRGMDSGEDTRDVSFSPNGLYVAAVDDMDSTRRPRLNVWSVSNGALIASREVGAIGDRLYAVDWSGPISGYSNGIIAIGGDNDMLIYFFSGTTYNQLSRTLDPFENQEILDVEWQPGGDKLVATHEGDGDGNYVYLYDWGSNTLSQFTHHTGDVTTVDWTTSGDRYATADWDGHIIICDGNSGQPLMQINGAAYNAVEWNLDGTEIFAARRDGGIDVYSLTDASGPMIAIAAPQNNSSTRDANVTVEGEITDPHFVRTATIRVNGGSPVSLLPLGSDGSFSHSVALNPGANTIVIDAEDGPGNVSAITLHITRLVDTAPPVFSNMSVIPASGAPGQVFTMSATIVDTWSGLDATSVRFDVEYPDGTNVITLTPTQNGDVFSAEWNSETAPGEGTYYLDVRATDLAGNAGEANNGATFSVIDDPEFGAIDFAPPNPTDQDEIVVTATVTDLSPLAGVTLEYRWNAGIPAVLSMTSIGNDQWQTTIPAHDLGTLTVVLSATDVRGNSSVTPPAEIVIVDASAPVFSNWQRSPSNITEHTIGAVRVYVNVTDIGGSGVEGTPQLDYHVGGSYDGYEPMTLDSGSTWYFDIPAQDWDALQGQTLRYRVSASDQAGNGAVSDEQTEFVDPINDAPVIDSHNPPELSVTVLPSTCQTFSVSATDEDSATLTFTWYLNETTVSNTTSYQFCANNYGVFPLTVVVSDGQLSDSIIWQVTTAAPPLAPTNLTVTRTSRLTLELNWSDNADNETAFLIERSPDGTSGWSQIGTTAANATTYEDPNLACETPYFYRVRAVRSDYNLTSGYTMVASATTGACCYQLTLSYAGHGDDPTAAPTHSGECPLAHYLPGETISLTAHPAPYWDVASWTGTTNDASTSTTNSLVMPASAHTASTHYTRDCLGSGMFEETASEITYEGGWATWTGTGPSGGRMQYTSDSSARAAFCVDGSAFVLFETKHPSFGTMEVCIDGACQSFSNTSPTVQWQVPVSFTGLSAGVHDVTVSNGPSGMLAVDAIVVGLPPSAPSGLRVSGTDIYGVSLQWVDNSADETAFHVYRDGAQVGSVAANVTTITDSLPDCGIDHTYEVRAANLFGESTGSNTIQAQAACPAALPTGYYEQTNPNIILTGPWTTYTSSAASGGTMVYSFSPTVRAAFRIEGSGLVVYRILHPSGGLMHVCIDGSCQDVSNASATVQWRVPVSFTGLGAGAHNVTITNPAGALLSFDAIAVGVPPTPPSGLQVSGTDIYEVSLAWTDNSTDETAFHVYRDGTQVGTVAANVTTFTDSVPDCGVNHTYAVRAANQFGESTSSNTILAQADCPGILTPGYYEQTDPNIVLSGPWTTYTTGAASGGSMVYSTSPTVSAVFRVEDTVLTLYRALHPSGGLMHVCIDGDCQDVNNYSASILLKQPVTFLNLGDGVHDVQITNPAGGLISLDAVEVKQPAPLSVGHHEQTHPSIFFSGTWATYSGSGPSGGSEKYTDDTAASIWFRFEGTQLTLYRIKHPSFGSMRVCVDTTCHDINSYSPSILWQQPVVFPGLGSGVHNVVITDGGPGLISLDAVQVDIASTGALPAGIPISGCFEEAHPAWEISGAWKPLFPAGASMDAILSYPSEWASGAFLTFEFAADGFGLVYHKGPYGGIAAIYLDGELVTRLDTYAPADAWLDDAVFEVQGLDPLRVHELRIVPTGERHPASQGYMIDIDRLDLPGYSGVYNDACRYPPEG